MRTQYGVNVRVLNNSWGGGGYQLGAGRRHPGQQQRRHSCSWPPRATAAPNNDTTAQYPANYSSPTSSPSRPPIRTINWPASVATGPRRSIWPPRAYRSTAPCPATDTPRIRARAWPRRTCRAWRRWPGPIIQTPRSPKIRNALLQGVDHIGALSGKVASGGRLNAYNTLQLLGGSAPTTPVLGSMIASPSGVTPGTAVTFTVQGASSPNGVSAVYFYSDANGNGVYDAGDTNIGVDNTVVNGTADLVVGTSAMTPGALQLLCPGRDNANQWSSRGHYDADYRGPGRSRKQCRRGHGNSRRQHDRGNDWDRRRRRTGSNSKPWPVSGILYPQRWQDCPIRF